MQPKLGPTAHGVKLFLERFDAKLLLSSLERESFLFFAVVSLVTCVGGSVVAWGGRSTAGSTSSVVVAAHRRRLLSQSLHLRGRRWAKLASAGALLLLLLLLSHRLHVLAARSACVVRRRSDLGHARTETASPVLLVLLLVVRCSHLLLRLGR